MTTFEIASLIVSVLGLGGIILSIQGSNKQARASVFADFCLRYSTIDEKTNGASANYRKSDVTGEEKENYYKFLDSYLDLFHQEFELKRRGMIDSGIWTIWVEYAKAHIKDRLFDDYWTSDRGRGAFGPNRAFVDFIEEVAR